MKQDNNLKTMKRMYPDGDAQDDTIVFKNAGWGSREAQDLRYAAIDGLYAKMKSRFLNLNNTLPRILEIGCGFGVFFNNYVRGEQYHGLDINPQAVRYCQDKYGQENFSIMDITSREFSEFLIDFEPDYVIASGVFDHAYLWEAINTKWLLHNIMKYTRCAIVSTMLYDVTPVKFRNALHAGDTIYTSPVDIIKLFSPEISKQQLFYQIRYDYMDNDYTFALIKPYQLMLDDKYRKWKGVADDPKRHGRV